MRCIIMINEIHIYAQRIFNIYHNNINEQKKENEDQQNSFSLLNTN